jgi:hypothetical protein
MTRITVLRPDKPEEVRQAGGYATRLPVEEGAVLAIIANGKPMARELLELIAEELRRELPIGGVEIHEKASAGVPIDADRARMLAARSRLVITGLGD